MSQEGSHSELTALSWSDVRRLKPSIVALGNFDGVHLGHARILDALVSEGHTASLDPIVVTFEPHPRYFFKPQEKPSLLTTPWEKWEQLKKWPVTVVSLAFNKALAELQPEAFIKEFLQDRLMGHRFLLGHDHRFGKGASGDFALLQAHVTDANRDVTVLEPYRLNEEVVSSSAIRIHLEASRLENANRLLGRPFSYLGKVVRGEGRGRGLGFATANLELDYPYKAVVAYGVYGGKARVNGKEYTAVTNIGKNPTFAGQTQKIEVHILDLDLDLYGEWLEFDLHLHIRPEFKFASVEELKRQIAQDVNTTRVYFSSNLL